MLLIPHYFDNSSAIFLFAVSEPGGEFCAILQIVGNDQSDQSNIKADLRAGGILGAVGAATSDSFSTVVHRATAGRETKLRLIQIGGDPVDSIDPTDMIAHALKFTSQVKEGKSEAFTALAVPYTTLDRPDGPNFIDILGAKENLTLLMQQRSDALSRLKAFDFVRSHPEQFTLPAT